MVMLYVTDLHGKRKDFLELAKNKSIDSVIVGGDLLPKIPVYTFKDGYYVMPASDLFLLDINLIKNYGKAEDLRLEEQHFVVHIDEELLKLLLLPKLVRKEKLSNDEVKCLEDYFIPHFLDNAPVHIKLQKYGKEALEAAYKRVLWRNSVLPTLMVPKDYLKSHLVDLSSLASEVEIKTIKVILDSLSDLKKKVLKSQLESGKGMIKDFESLGKAVYAMPGNDDAKGLLGLLNKSKLKQLHMSKYKVNKDLWIAGYSFISPSGFLYKDWERSEEDIFQDLENLVMETKPEKTIYVMHEVPYHTGLDINEKNKHVGSKSVRSFIEKYKPLMTLHGHIHGSPWRGSWYEKIGTTLSINPGGLHEDGIDGVRIDSENSLVSHTKLGQIRL